MFLSMLNMHNMESPVFGKCSANARMIRVRDFLNPAVCATHVHFLPQTHLSGPNENESIEQH